MVEARDIMTTEVISVRRHTPICEAAELLIKHEITGMPVVDADMTLVGILTEKDLLRLLHSHEDEEERVVAVGPFEEFAVVVLEDVHGLDRHLERAHRGQGGTGMPRSAVHRAGKPQRSADGSVDVVFGGFEIEADVGLFPAPDQGECAVAAGFLFYDDMEYDVSLRFHAEFFHGPE